MVHEKAPFMKGDLWGQAEVRASCVTVFYLTPF